MADNKYRLKFQLGNGTQLDAGVIEVPQGENGKSAYQYAQEKGYIGTEEEYAQDVNPTRVSSKIDNHQKRLDNIENALYPDIVTPVTDDSVAHIKNVPLNALPHAEVAAVGGMTRKCNNLIPYPYYANGTHTLDGVTWTVNADGSVTANGTASGNSVFVITNYKTPVSAGTYTLSGIPAKGSAKTFMIQTGDRNGFAANNINVSGDAFTLTTETSVLIQLVVFNGYTANNLVFKPMLNEGSTALPYEPYFEGLRSAPVTGIESVGKNILNVATATVWTKSLGSYDDSLKAEQYGTGMKLTALQDSAASWNHGGFTIGLTKEFLGKTLTLSVGNVEYFPKRDKSNPILLFGICKHDNYYLGGSSNLGPNKSGGPTSMTFTVPLDADYITYPYLRVSFYISSGGEVLAGDYVIYEDIMVEVADSASEYAPYTKHTLPVPEAVQALEGYGWGINADCYNYIDFEKKQFVQSVGCVDMGTLTWTVSQTGGGKTYFYTEGLKAVANYPNYSMANNILCGKYKNVPASTGFDADKIITISNNGRMYVTDSAYTNSTTFKAAMAGEMLYYVLATPIINDISHLLSDDNYIPVEGGGSITMVNEHKYAVPSTIEYTVKGASAQ